MKLGLQLHQERGLEGVFEEARLADEQGYDSIWLFDHLMDVSGKDGEDGPLDSFTLMTALGTLTQKTRLAWAMLNLGFRPPALLAKMLATLDQISGGRVIASVGAGWFESEYKAYNIPLIEDHDGRVTYGREVLDLMKQLWTQPAPHKVTYEGEYVQVRELPFNPAPLQKPHPPIWVGGDSEETLKTVKQFADGWVMLRSGTPEILSNVRSAPDWPKREMTLVKNIRLYVGRTHEEALADAEREYEMTASAAGAGRPPSRDDFIGGSVLGTPDECLRQLAEMESWGINYARLNFLVLANQEKVANLLIPRLPEILERSGAS